MHHSPSQECQPIRARGGGGGPIAGRVDGCLPGLSRIFSKYHNTIMNLLNPPLVTGHSEEEISSLVVVEEI